MHYEKLRMRATIKEVTCYSCVIIYCLIFFYTKVFFFWVAIPMYDEISLIKSVFIAYKEEAGSSILFFMWVHSEGCTRVSFKKKKDTKVIYDIIIILWWLFLVVIIVQILIINNWKFMKHCLHIEALLTFLYSFDENAPFPIIVVMYFFWKSASYNVTSPTMMYN